MGTTRELTQNEIARVCLHAGNDPAGGRLIKAQAYQDVTEEARLVVMIDYGIKGLKKMDFSVEELDRAEGKLPKRLEDLPLKELEAKAKGLDVQVSGRKGRAKLVVAIRKAQGTERAPAPPTPAEKAEEPLLPPSESPAEPTAPAASADAVSDENEQQDNEPGYTEVLEAFGEKIGQVLIKGGYPNLAAVREAPDESLLGLKGIGARTLESIRKAQG